VDDTKPSKSERKREHLALQKLGEALLLLQEEDLRAMDLDEDLLDAVLEAKRISKRGALPRQKQYIGKLMGRVDPEPIRSALRRVKNRGQGRSNRS
jgi:ribosome-associated protein